MNTQAHDFTLDGFALTGVDSFGVLWTVESMDGWHSAPPMRTAHQPKAQQAGSWPATGFTGERVVTLQGKTTASDTPNLEGAASRLCAVLASGGMGDLVGVSAFGALSMTVALEDAPKFNPVSDRIALWQVTVTAPDPLKYGAPTYGTAGLSTATPGAGLVYPLVYPLSYGVAPGVTPGAVSVPNTGTAPYWPRLRIDGPVTNPVVTMVESGAWVRFNGTLLAGQWLDLDMGARRVLIQGQVSVRHKVSSSGDWLSVPPGGGTIAWSADTADPASLLSVWGYEGSWF